jgi:Zn-finger nucleic acid-binding protein
MTLNTIGESACAQCGAALEPEPEASATPQVCPRGCGALSAIGDVLECERCGGLFLSHAALAAIVTAHRAHETERRTSIAPTTPAPDQIVYRPCPACNNRMNRTMFGKSSGVIVDVCKTHGTWFDARELTASLAFVERGGLALVEKREATRKAEEARRAAVDARTKQLEALNQPIGYGIDHYRSARDESLHSLIDILLSL